MSVFPYNNVATAKLMISDYGIKLCNGGIRICYGISGELYCLPMFVINPPEKYGIEKIVKEDNKPGEAIKVVCSKSFRLK